MNSRGLMDPCFVLSQCKGLAGDGTGIQTTEGLTLKRISCEHSIVQVTLAKTAESLHKLGHQGPVFMECVCCEDEDYNTSIECLDFYFTPPDGFWAAFARGLDMPLFYFLDRLANPRRPRTPFDFTGGYVSARKLSIPPYPLTEAPWLSPEERRSLSSLMPVYEVFHSEDVYWSGVQRKNGMLKVLSPVLGYITAKGAAAHNTLDDIKYTASELNIPYAQVATHCTDVDFVEQLPTYTAQTQLEMEAV